MPEEVSDIMRQRLEDAAATDYLFPNCDVRLLLLEIDRLKASQAWDVIENVPLHEDVLLAARTREGISWHYDVGMVIQFNGILIESNWDYGLPPTHFKRLTPP